MRLRTTLTLAFAFVCLLQVAVVAPFAQRQLSRTLDTQLQGQLDRMQLAARTALDGSALQVQATLDGLVQSEALEQVARELSADRPEQRGAGEALMQARGLSVLSLFDEGGRTLSSGHLPARTGDLDPALFELTRGPPTAVPRLVELPGPQGTRWLPALLTARRLDYGERRFWVVGGVVLDDAAAGHLAALTGARVQLTARGLPTSSSGPPPPPPLAERRLPLGSEIELELLFSAAAQRSVERQLLQAFLLLFGLGLLLAVGVGAAVSRSITRPVEALTAAAARISGGALEARVEQPASGELGTLISTFNRMTADLQQTTSQLIASERIAAWQEVAKRLAHEIKNPLTPIKMSLETLVAAREAHHPRFDGLFDETAGVVLEEVERLRKIVEEFTRFARLPKSELAPVDLGALAGQVLALYAHPPAGLSLTSALSPGLSINADRDQLSQVLINLLKNAEEAVAGAEGQIHVSARTEGPDAVLEVRDSGPGVRLEDRAHLFDPYFTTKTGGTGLGLAIAARICEDHHGRLELDPSPPPGALFRIRVPLLKKY